MAIANTDHEFSPEELREALVALERSRQHETELRLETEGLLEGLQALTEARNTQQVFDNLIRALRRFLPFEDAFMLLAAAPDRLESMRATVPLFEGLAWPLGDAMRRVLEGRIVHLYDVSLVPEWQEQPEAVRSRVHSAILAPLRTETTCAVLVFVHSQAAFFSRNHAHLLERFAPLTNQAMASIEYREKLEQRAEQLRQANEALETTHLQLLQAEKLASIGQLAAGVAHEINNPIGFVLSNLGTLGHYIDDLMELLAAYEIMEEDVPPYVPSARRLHVLKERVDLGYLKQDAQDLMAESRDGCTRVRKIVQDLRDFSRVGTTEEWQMANVEQGLESTLNIAWNDLKYKVELSKEFGGVPDIECLPSQLNQVFLNLIVNAGQAIEQSGRIWIRTGCEDDGVRIEIADDGCGIPAEHLSRIFDPFFTTKRIGVGTGLGLALSYGIVKKHNGRIEVDSEPGRGSRFRIWLPLRHDATQRSEGQ